LHLFFMLKYHCDLKWYCHSRFLAKKKSIDVKNINYLHILAAVVLNVNTETEKLIVSMVERSLPEENSDIKLVSSSVINA
jgi:hypothetical protein